MTQVRFCLTEDEESGQHLLTAEVAQIAGVTPAAVRMAEVQGRIKAAHITPVLRTRIYHKDEAERFAAARQEHMTLMGKLKAVWRRAEK